MSIYDIHDLTTLKASHRATVTRAEVARVLGIDVRTVSRAIADGQLPAIQVGRRLLVPREPLVRLLTEDQDQSAA